MLSSSPSSLYDSSWDNYGYFQTARKKLFSPGVIDALALFIDRKQSAKIPNVVKKSIHNISDLSNYIHDASSIAWQHTFLIISQEYSWGRLRFTYAAFQKLMRSMAIFCSFIDVLSAFGVKASDDERLNLGFRSCAPRKDCPKERHVCYNVLYMEKHSRDLRDPWSLRQTGIYHQLGKELTDSRWIILNPAETVLSRLESLFQTGSHQCHLALHCEFLSVLSSNWTSYVEYLNSEWRRYNDKSCYAIVEPKEGGYIISYLDVQELHALQIKTHRAETAIQSCLDIASGCENHFLSCLKLSGSELSCGQCQNLLDVYSADMARHSNQLQSLKWRLQSTRDLLLQILLFRNEELLQTSNRASCRTLEALFQITDQGRHQQKTLTRLLSQGQADSAMLKALSIVSTVCLPASLVASIFSSNLIQTVDQQLQRQSALGLVPSPQFWLYFAIALPLMGFTLMWIIYLERKARRVTLHA